MQYQEREKREYAYGNYHSVANGKSYYNITCPFCQETVRAYVWSLRGGGKKCPCGALHTSFGFTYAPALKKEK